ncbi:MAG: 6-aminohexanoate-cyclic-dimer hydrolase [Acidimicrobiia bacterium]
MSDALAGLDATAQAALVRDGDASPAELVAAAITRIERVDPALNAVIVTRFEEALDEARGTLPDGPFRGVPYLLKDLGPGGQMRGLAHHRGNVALRAAGFTYAGPDSHIVRRLRGAGFVIVGKTNTPELGFSVTTEPVAYGPSHNPWDASRTPAGSSGGSAAAVAAGLVPAAGASDGGGSIRMPAAACGLVGLKVSRGRVSAGPSAAGNGRSVEHCVTRTVRDCAAILDVLAGYETGDPIVAPGPPVSFRDAASTPPPRSRVAVDTTSPLGLPVDHEIVTAVDAVARTLEELGHRVAPGRVDGLRDPEIGLGAIFPVHAAATAAAVDAVARDLGRPVTEEDVEPATWVHAEQGRGYTGVEIVAAQDRIVAWTRRVGAFFETHDLLVTPTLGMLPPPLGRLRSASPAGNGPRARESGGETGEVPGEVPGEAEVMLLQAQFSGFCPAWNWTGFPAITLPLGHSTSGLPIGVQLVAAYGREHLLLQAAAQLEQAMPWADHRPPIHA